MLGQDYVFGEVKAIDAPKLTILRPDSVSQTVELNEETSLRKGRDSITMADIQAGDHIMVRGGMVNNAFQPKSVMVISPEQWKRMQEMGSGGANAASRKAAAGCQQAAESSGAATLKLFFRIILFLCLVTCVIGNLRAQDNPTPAQSVPAVPQTNAASAPQTTYQITGSVHSGKTPLPGVTLTASNTLTGKKYTAATISDGTFALSGLPRGTICLACRVHGLRGADAGSGAEPRKSVR